MNVTCVNQLKGTAWFFKFAEELKSADTVKGILTHTLEALSCVPGHTSGARSAFYEYNDIAGTLRVLLTTENGHEIKKKSHYKNRKPKASGPFHTVMEKRCWLYFPDLRVTNPQGFLLSSEGHLSLLAEEIKLDAKIIGDYLSDHGHAYGNGDNPMDLVFGCFSGQRVIGGNDEVFGVLRLDGFSKGVAVKPVDLSIKDFLFSLSFITKESALYIRRLNARFEAEEQIKLLEKAEKASHRISHNVRSVFTSIKLDLQRIMKYFEDKELLNDLVERIDGIAYLMDVYTSFSFICINERPMLDDIEDEILKHKKAFEDFKARTLRVAKFLRGFSSITAATLSCLEEEKLLFLEKIKTIPEKRTSLEKVGARFIDNLVKSFNKAFCLFEGHTKRVIEGNFNIEIDLRKVEIKELFAGIDNYPVFLERELPYAILADADNIRLVIMGLIENAVKYKHPDRDPDIKIYCGINDMGMLEISVVDNGIGLSIENMKRIFISCFRVNIDVPGLGVGLAGYREVVSAMGGQLWVESAGEGMGASFKFTIPIN